MSQHENDETDNESIDPFEDLSRPAFEEKQRKTKADREAEKQQKMQEKIAKREQKEMLKQAAAEEKAAKKAAKQKPSVVEQPEHLGDYEIEESNETGEILGKDKRVLMAKITQFKELFCENPKIKNFKVKKNPTVEELQNVINELEIIVDISSCDGFMLDSILQCIKLVEGISANTRNYNVSGMSELLKANKEFHRLCKMLFIKYNCFTSCPPEMQMLLLVATTAYICKSKNTNKQEITNFLNMPV